MSAIPMLPETATPLSGVAPARGRQNKHGGEEAAFLMAFATALDGLGVAPEITFDVDGHGGGELGDTDGDLDLTAGAVPADLPAQVVESAYAVVAMLYARAAVDMDAGDAGGAGQAQLIEPVRMEIVHETDGTVVLDVVASRPPVEAADAALEAEALETAESLEAAVALEAAEAAHAPADTDALEAAEAAEAPEAPATADLQKAGDAADATDGADAATVSADADAAGATEPAQSPRDDASEEAEATAGERPDTSFTASRSHEVSAQTRRPAAGARAEAAAATSSAVRGAEGAAAAAQPASVAEAAPAPPPAPAPAGMVDRVLDAVEQLENRPPPRRMVIEVGDLRLTVALRGDEIRLSVSGGRAGGELPAEWAREVGHALAGRGFHLGGGDRQDREHPEDARDRPAPPRTAARRLPNPTTTAGWRL